MDDPTHRDSFWARRRANRERLAQERRALRSEFDLDRPRGFAAWRALAANVGDLERARLRSHADAAPQGATPAKVGASARAPRV